MDSDVTEYSLLVRYQLILMWPGSLDDPELVARGLPAKSHNINRGNGPEFSASTGAYSADSTQ
jgi:hypothetical protein